MNIFCLLFIVKNPKEDENKKYLSSYYSDNTNELDFI